MNPIALLTAFTLLASVQVLIVVIHVYSFIPIPWPSPVPPGLEPERENFFYIIFLTLICSIGVAAFKWIYPKLEQQQSRRDFAIFLMAECWWVFWQLFAFFKWTTYRYPFYNVLSYEDGSWVTPFFYGVLACSILSKVFWPELSRWWKIGLSWQPGLPWVQLADGLVIAGILAALAVPHTEDVLALNYVWDQMNRLDVWTAGGQWTYDAVIWTMIISAVILFSAFYLFLRRWLHSVTLAIFGVVLSIKMQLFHYGLSPIWLIPPSTDGWLSLQGFDHVPMYKPLQVRQFFPFFMTFLVPMFFVLNLTLLWFRRTIALKRGDMPAIAMAAAGLLIYPWAIAHPTIGAYGMVAIPFMALICFWIDICRQMLTINLRRVAGVGLATVAVIMLLTNRLFIIYPHIWQPQSQRFIKERQFYQQWFNFDEDAALIQKWQPNDRVAILSSFEVGILQKAYRSSFLPHTPVMASTLPINPSVGGFRLKTKAQVMDVINALDEWSPPVFFIDKKIWALNEQQMAGSALAVLMERLHGHYEPVAQGKYLIVLKKKE